MAGGGHLIFLQLFHAESSTYTYLLGDPGVRQAALVDPVRDELDRYLALLDRLDLRLAWSLETHVHADHVTAAGPLADRTGCRTAVHRAGGVGCADVQLSGGERLAVGALEVGVLHTPGHTPGCVSYRLADRVLTGDALLIEGCGRTDFQGGDAGALYDSLTGTLLALPDATLVFPGHDYQGQAASTIGWERAHNRRLEGVDRGGFVARMAALRIPPPRLIDRAVPANLSCGRGAPAKA